MEDNYKEWEERIIDINKIKIKPALVMYDRCPGWILCQENLYSFDYPGQG